MDTSRLAATRIALAKELMPSCCPDGVLPSRACCCLLLAAAAVMVQAIRIGYVVALLVQVPHQQRATCSSRYIVTLVRKD